MPKPGSRSTWNRRNSQHRCQNSRESITWNHIPCPCVWERYWGYCIDGCAWREWNDRKLFHWSNQRSLLLLYEETTGKKGGPLRHIRAPVMEPELKVKVQYRFKSQVYHNIALRQPTEYEMVRDDATIYIVLQLQTAFRAHILPIGNSVVRLNGNSARFVTFWISFGTPNALWMRNRKLKQRKSV